MKTMKRRFQKLAQKVGSPLSSSGRENGGEIRLCFGGAFMFIGVGLVRVYYSQHLARIEILWVADTIRPLALAIWLIVPTPHALSKLFACGPHIANQRESWEHEPRGAIKRGLIGSIIPSFCHQPSSPVSGPLAQLKLHLAHPPTVTAPTHPRAGPFNADKRPKPTMLHQPRFPLTADEGIEREPPVSPFGPPLAKTPATDCLFRSTSSISFPTRLQSLPAAQPGTVA